MPEEFGGLGYAPVIVGVFQSLGNGFLLLVERHVAEFGVFRDAVVMRVRGGGFHRLEGALVVESLHALHHHVCKHGTGVVTYHAPGLAAVERPDGKHVLSALVVVLQHGVGEVGLEGFVHQVEQGMEGPVSIP